MSRIDLLLAVSALAGCSQTYATDKTQDAFADTAEDTADTADADTDTDTDSDSDSDSDSDTDTGTDTNIDTGGACPSSVSEMAWVVEHLEVSTATNGLDLDGDGRGDNVIAAMRDAINASILETFPGTPVVLVWQMWDVDDWCDDSDITGAFMSPEDVDGDHADDYSGSEAFSAGADLDAGGHAVENGGGSIGSGVYTFELAHGELWVGGFTLTNATPVLVVGTADESANAGQFGFGLAIPLMEEIAISEGYDPALATALADLDADGDGELDSLSVTFEFTAVPATVY